MATLGVTSVKLGPMSAVGLILLDRKQIGRGHENRA